MTSECASVWYNDTDTTVRQNGNQSGIGKLFCSSDIKTSALLPFITTFTLLIAYLSLFVQLLLIVSVRYIATLTVNIRLLLYNHSGANTLLAVCMIVQSVYNLFAQANNFPALALPTCTGVQALRIFATLLVIFSIVAGGVERCVSTYRAVQGDDQNKVSLVLTLTLTVVYCGSAALLLTQIVRNDGSLSRKNSCRSICFCDAVLAERNEHLMLEALDTCLAIEIVLICIFACACIINRKKLKSQGMNVARNNLSKRINILNHLTATAAILPMFAMHGVAVVLALVFALFGIVSKTPLHAVLFLQLSNFVFTLYGCLFPLLCLRFADRTQNAIAQTTFVGMMLDFVFANSTDWKNRKARKYLLAKRMEGESHAETPPSAMLNTVCANVNFSSDASPSSNLAVPAKSFHGRGTENQYFEKMEQSDVTNMLDTDRHYCKRGGIYNGLTIIVKPAVETISSV